MLRTPSPFYSQPDNILYICERKHQWLLSAMWVWHTEHKRRMSGACEWHVQRHRGGWFSLYQSRGGWSCSSTAVQQLWLSSLECVVFFFNGMFPTHVMWYTHDHVTLLQTKVRWLTSMHVLCFAQWPLHFPQWPLRFPQWPLQHNRQRSALQLQLASAYLLPTLVNISFLVDPSVNCVPLDNIIALTLLFPLNPLSTTHVSTIDNTHTCHNHFQDIIIEFSWVLHIQVIKNI